MTPGIQVPSAWQIVTSSAIVKAGFVQEYVTVSPGTKMVEVVNEGLLAEFGGEFGGGVQTEHEFEVVEITKNCLTQ